MAREFHALGLQPGGNGGSWYLDVPLRTASLIGEPRFELVAGPGKRSFGWGSGDVILGPSTAFAKQDITAPMVFVGFGIDAPDLGLDDYAGLDVRGKIVAALAGAPNGIDSETAAHLGERKAAMAARRGAIGLVTIPTEAWEKASPWDVRLRRSRTTQMTWIGRDSADQPAFTSAVSRNVATRLFAAAPRSYSQVRAEAAVEGRPTGFPLRATIRVRRTSSWKDIASPEVIGLLPGSDPKLRDEYIVLMGHLDHLGPASTGTDRIFNGALDNAAGIATMLEVARALTSSGKRPRRSILFIAHTAEEKGLLGADFYARHPTVPIDRIVAGVDLDMPVLLYDFTDVIAFGAEHSTVAEAVRKAAGSIGIALSPDPMPEQNIFVRSDHYMFVKQGVPSILLMTGYANGGEAHWKHFLANSYHSVRDDLSQPIDWNAAAKFARLNYLIARELADQPDRPRWYQGNMFGDLYAPKAPRAPCTRPEGCGPRLDLARPRP